MLQLIKKHLLKIIDDIDSGNTNLNEEEQLKVVELLKKFNSREKMISKYQAYTYLNLRRAQFDNLVREGKIPKGIKETGFKELRWKLSDIKKIAKDRNTSINNKNV